MANLKAMTIGGATLDTIIEYEEMETMVIQKPSETNAYLLLEEGAKIEVTKQKCFSGGGATNAAVALKKLGYDVSFFGKVGKDNAGKSILDELSNYGIDVSEVRYSNEYGTATSYVVPSLKGDRTIFAYRGANRNLITEDIPVDAIKAADFVYVTSLSKTSAARLPEIVKIAHDNGTKVAINPGASQLKCGDGFIKQSLSSIDILILNYQEAKTLMLSLLSSDDLQLQLGKEEGKNLLDSQPEYQDTTFTLREFFKLVLGMGPRIVVVTDGADGVYVATPETLYFQPSLKVENVVNTLGAGDSFGSSFCAAIYANESIDTAVKYGLANSASVIQYHDAKTGLLDLDKMQKRIQEIKVEMNIIEW